MTASNLTIVITPNVVRVQKHNVVKVKYTKNLDFWSKSLLRSFGSQKQFTIQWTLESALDWPLWLRWSLHNISGSFRWQRSLWPSFFVCVILIYFWHTCKKEQKKAAYCPTVWFDDKTCRMTVFANGVKGCPLPLSPAGPPRPPSARWKTLGSRSKDMANLF